MIRKVSRSDARHRDAPGVDLGRRASLHLSHYWKARSYVGTGDGKKQTPAMGLGVETRLRPDRAGGA